MRSIKLAAYDKAGILAIDLYNLVEALEPYGRNLRWSVLWIRGTGPGMTLLEDEVRSRDTGLVTDWEGLVHISKRVVQIEDAWIIGTDPEASLPTREHETDPAYAIVMEAVDSTYWLFCSSRDQIMTQVARRFGQGTALGE